MLKIQTLKYKENILLICAILPALIYIAIIFYSTKYSFAWTDEYCYISTIISQNYNFIDYIIYYYKHWTFTYTTYIATYLQYMFANSLNMEYRQLNSIVIVIITIYSIYTNYTFIRLFFSEKNNKLLFLTLSLYFFIINFGLNTSILESYYYVQGNTAGGFLAFSVILHATTMLYKLIVNGNFKYLDFIKFLIFSIAINGFHLIWPLTFMLVATMLILYNYKFSLKNYKLLLCLGSIYLLIFIFSVISPGSFERYFTEHSRGNFKGALNFFDLQIFYIGYLKFYIKNWPILLGILIFAIYISNSIKLKYLNHISIAFLLSFPIIVLIYFTITGLIPESRHTSALMIAFNFFLTLMMISLVSHFFNEKFNISFDRRYNLIILVISCILFVNSHIQKRFFIELFENAPPYYKSQIERENYIKEQQGLNTGLVKLNKFPKNQEWYPVFRGTDVTPDKDNWVNSCFASANKLGNVIIRDE